MISFRCPKCLGDSQAPDGSEGIKIRCPKCLEMVTIPGNHSPQPVPLALNSISFPCPSCGKTVSGRNPGEKVRCGACGQKIITPVLQNFHAKTRLVSEDITPPHDPPPPPEPCLPQPHPPPAPSTPYQSHKALLDKLEEDNIPAVLPTDETTAPVPDSQPIIRLPSIRPDKDAVIQKRIFTYILIGGSLATMLIVVLANLDFTDSNVAAFFMFFGILIFIGIAVGAVVLSIGISRSCPKCHKMWSKRFWQKKLIGRKRGWGLVTRRAKSSHTSYLPGQTTTSGYQPGQAIFGSGTTTWKERVPVIRELYRSYFFCASCQHRWEKETEIEYEDFGD
jgi:DNA-directed RNA polymerase subunit RPC12/RpoP